MAKRASVKIFTSLDILVAGREFWVLSWAEHIISNPSLPRFTDEEPEAWRTQVQWSMGS